MALTTFQKNVHYISSEYSRIKDRRVSMSELGELLGVRKLTILNWLSGKHEPKINGLQALSAKLKDIFSWDVAPGDLTIIELRGKYNADNDVEKNKEALTRSYEANIDDISKIAKRLKEARAEKGWSLMQVSLKTMDMFPNKKEYQVSHTHVKDMEDGVIANLNIQKLRALATIYGKKIEYLLFGWMPYDRIAIDRARKVIVIPMDDNLLSKSDDELITYAEQSAVIIKQLANFSHKETD